MQRTKLGLCLVILGALGPMACATDPLAGNDDKGWNCQTADVLSCGGYCGE